MRLKANPDPKKHEKFTFFHRKNTILLCGSENFFVKNAIFHKKSQKISFFQNRRFFGSKAISVLKSVIFFTLFSKMNIFQNTPESLHRRFWKFRTKNFFPKFQRVKKWQKSTIFRYVFNTILKRRPWLLDAK